MKINYIIFLGFIFQSVLYSCKTVGPEAEKYSYVKVPWNSINSIEQKDDKVSLKKSVEDNLKWLNRKRPDSVLKYQDFYFYVKDYICSSKNFLHDINNNLTIKTSLENNFNLFKVKITSEKPVIFTGYYIPYVQASLTPSAKFQVPVYKMPKDMVFVNLEDFNSELKDKFIRGRIEKNRLLPYWSREEIVDDKVLHNKGLEIAWLQDKVDLFFIEIQGSGLLTFPDNSKKFIRYSGQNWREYYPIGAALLNEGKLQRHDVSMQSIKRWLKENPEEQSRILNTNKSFVFFNLENEGPFGNINVKLNPERSLAADQKVFPAGSLMLVDFEMPKILEQSNNQQFSQLAFVHDTGGAIRGPTRIDVFWGEGENAGNIAGVSKQEGSLYVLAPRYNCNKSLISYYGFDP